MSLQNASTGHISGRLIGRRERIGTEVAEVKTLRNVALIICEAIEFLFNRYLAFLYGAFVLILFDFDAKNSLTNKILFSFFFCVNSTISVTLI